MGVVKGVFKRLLGITRLHGRIDTIQQSMDDRLRATEQSTQAAAAELQRAEGEKLLARVRDEYTTLPRFLYHHPFDYLASTFPPAFDPPVTVPGESLPVPAAADRMGYAPDDPAAYLAWGKRDHDFLRGLMDRHGPPPRGARVLDFGCSSGRVLRHFAAEHHELGWKPMGVDVQARPVEWIRRHLPAYFEVAVCSAMPHLPFEDRSLDVVYAISVFTHIKYLWDMWVQELRRVLKPGGLLLASFQAEPAWEHYHRHRHHEQVSGMLPDVMLRRPVMDVDHFGYGDQCVSQVFWKADVARQFWGRYMDVIGVLPPPPVSFQNWMVCRKPG